jgi:uncharacterized membrane protein YphA (DoxX/SURF4 family)
MLDPERLRAKWSSDVERLASHYGFDKDQRDKAATLLQQADDFAAIWFSDKEAREKRYQYYHDLGQVQKVEGSPDALSFERERAAAKRKDLDVERKRLIADLQARAASLHAGVIELAKPEQREASGPYVGPWTKLDQINAMTMYGLIAMGLCLMLGLLGPIAALAGAVFLGQIYLSMPPWPGLPVSPVAEGHYSIVNKNLIEMLACLALVFIPTSFWIGLDSMLFGWMFRGRDRADSSPRSTAGSGSSTIGTTTTGRGAAVDVKPIPLSSQGLTERE